MIIPVTVISIANLLLFSRLNKFSPTSTLLYPKIIIRFYYYNNTQQTINQEIIKNHILRNTMALR